MKAAFCPICGKDDNVRKVSSVVTGGISSGSFAGPTGGLTYSQHGGTGGAASYTSLSGKMVQEHSRLLAPPAEPKKQSFASCLLVLLAIWSGCTGVASVIGGIASLFKGNISEFVIGLMILAFAAVCVLLAIFLKRASSKFAREENERYPIRKAAWEKAMEIWGRLYYCYRDDLVFDPEAGRSAPIQRMRELLAE